MMTLVFAVYDSKTQFYGTPFFFPTVSAAIRAFSDGVNDPNPNNLWYRHPGDYVLYEIGSYDDTSGKLTYLMEHLHHGIGSAFKLKEPVREDTPPAPSISPELLKDLMLARQVNTVSPVPEVKKSFISRLLRI